MELMDDIKGLTAGVSSRKRGKRRYFWEYSEQLPPSKQERMLKPSEWDRHTLPSNLYQKNGPLHGMHTAHKEEKQYYVYSAESNTQNCILVLLIL